MASISRLKTHHCPWIGGSLLGQDLQCNGLAEQNLPGLVNGAHTSLAQLDEQLVFAEASQLGQRWLGNWCGDGTTATRPTASAASMARR